MSWSKMGSVPNPIIVDAAGTAGSGYVLKAYLPGTTTSTSIAINSGGDSLQASVTANADGIWEVSGNEIIPHIDRTHKWGIFANSTDAAANTPFYMGPFDNVTQVVEIGGATTQPIYVATTSVMTASTGSILGGVFVTAEFSTGTGGGGTYDIVLTSSVTPNGQDVIIGVSDALISFVLRVHGEIQVNQLGAVGNGTADDTLPIHRAIDLAVAKGITVLFTELKYRVTTMYTQSVTRGNILIKGIGSGREEISTKSTTIILDNASAAVSFMKMTASGHLQVQNIDFKSEQYALDRAFFDFTVPLIFHTFNNVNFEAVERPLVFRAGAPFQSCSLINVQFRNSGTIHCEDPTTISTLYTLINVNHEGATPINTDKSVCNLQGVRHINATNFLLEGTVPATGWTALRLYSPDVDWGVGHTASFDNLWIEFSGTALLHSVDQRSGRVRIRGSNSFIRPSDTQYNLTNKARVEVDGSAFTSTKFDAADAFITDSNNCKIILSNVGLRDFHQPLMNKSITHDNIYIADSDTGRGQINISTDISKLIYKYDGGFVDGEEGVLVLSSGTTSTPSIDTNMRRMLSIIPLANVIDVRLGAKTRGELDVGDIVLVTCKLRLPTYTGGSVQLKGVLDATLVSALTLDSTNSATVVELMLPIRISGTPAIIGFAAGGVSLAGVSGTLDILSLNIWHGQSMPPSTYDIRTKNIVTWNSAAPTAGQWDRGDVVRNNAPAVGAFKEQVCTVAGTPGTWVSTGNL